MSFRKDKEVHKLLIVAGRHRENVDCPYYSNCRDMAAFKGKSFVPCHSSWMKPPRYQEDTKDLHGDIPPDNTTEFNSAIIPDDSIGHKRVTTHDNHNLSDRPTTNNNFRLIDGDKDDINVNQRERFKPLNDSRIWNRDKKPEDHTSGNQLTPKDKKSNNITYQDRSKDHKNIPIVDKHKERNNTTNLDRINLNNNSKVGNRFSLCDNIKPSNGDRYHEDTTVIDRPSNGKDNMPLDGHKSTDNFKIANRGTQRNDFIIPDRIKVPKSIREFELFLQQ